MDITEKLLSHYAGVVNESGLDVGKALSGRHFALISYEGVLDVYDVITSAETVANSELDLGHVCAIVEVDLVHVTNESGGE
jgi:hypothetical protein